MQPIATEFAEGNYRYTQIERQGDVAIYRQTHKENPKVIRYEVVRIRVAPAHTWPNGMVSPEREVYPGSKQWGNLGFTCYSIDQSMAVVRRLLSTKDDV